MPTAPGGTFTIQGAVLFGATGSLWLGGSGAPPSTPQFPEAGWSVTVAGSFAGDSSTIDITFVAGHAVLMTSAHGTFFIEDAPPGFTPTTALRASWVNTIGFSTVTCSLHADVGGGAGTYDIDGAFIGGGPPIVLPDGIAWALLRTYGLHVALTMKGLVGTETPTVSWDQTSYKIFGNYVIAFYWWIIPPVDACGEAHESHLTYGADPGPPWQRFDATDPDAAPTPTVAAVTPTVGDLAGGTAIRIQGSGFGDGATVTVGGVAATGVTVRDQFTIDAVTPAHAAGTVPIIVTNPDGVSSS